MSFKNRHLFMKLFFQTIRGRLALSKWVLREYWIEWKDLENCVHNFINIPEHVFKIMTPPTLFITASKSWHYLLYLLLLFHISMILMPSSFLLKSHAWIFLLNFIVSSKPSLQESRDPVFLFIHIDVFSTELGDSMFFLSTCEKILSESGVYIEIRKVERWS